MLDSKEQQRYERQIMLPGFGLAGQEKLKRAVILVVGAGGLGSVVLTYLTAAGVGQIRVIDFDIVELSNLNRQTLNWTKDIGRKKVDSAREKLELLNSHVKIENIGNELNEENIQKLVIGCNLIVDALDNLPSRYLLNKIAMAKNLPLIHGAIYGYEGRVTTMIPGRTPCLKCLYREASPPREIPVIGVIPAVIGCLQATEALKYLLGIGKLLTGRLLLYDALSLEFAEVQLAADPDCRECGQFNSF